LLGALPDLFDTHERRRVYSGVVPGALSAIGTVLRTASGLDAQQGATLDIADIVMLPMHLRGSEDQVRQRETIDRFQLLKSFHEK
jgi:hypothetical protein